MLPSITSRTVTRDSRASSLKCKAGPNRQITECHDAVSISNWLKEWLKSEAKFPVEVVSKRKFERKKINANESHH